MANLDKTEQPAFEKTLNKYTDKYITECNDGDNITRIKNRKGNIHIEPYSLGGKLLRLDVTGSTQRFYNFRLSKCIRLGLVLAENPQPLALNNNECDDGGYFIFNNECIDIVVNVFGLRKRLVMTDERRQELSDRAKEIFKHD